VPGKLKLEISLNI